jgi:hypothetical protein
MLSGRARMCSQRGASSGIRGATVEHSRARKVASRLRGGLEISIGGALWRIRPIPAVCRDIRRLWAGQGISSQ